MRQQCDSTLDTSRQLCISYIYRLDWTSTSFDGTRHEYTISAGDGESLKLHSVISRAVPFARMSTGSNYTRKNFLLADSRAKDENYGLATTSRIRRASGTIMQVTRRIRAPAEWDAKKLYRTLNNKGIQPPHKRNVPPVKTKQIK